MKSFIEYEKIVKIIEKRRDDKVNRFCDYRYEFGNKLSIDDVITLAQSTKELEQIQDEIGDAVPKVADMEPIFDAIDKIANMGGTWEYNESVKTLADYLGIDIDDTVVGRSIKQESNKDNEE